MGKSIKIFASNVNVQQRVTSVEEDFNNQVDKVTCFVDASQSLSPAIFPLSLSSPNRLMNKGAMMSGMEFRLGLSNMAVHSLRPIWL